MKKVKLLFLGLMASLSGFSQAPQTLLASGSQWSYLDNGTDQGTNWRQPAFDYSTWATGAAPLGYGDPMTTTISYGSDANNKHITYYFLKDIEVDLNDLPDEVKFGIRRDDGVVVYVNGVEVLRDNMPEGPITNTTLAPNTIGGGDETTFFTFELPKTIFQNGTNRIAIELHQRDIYSSDLGVDMYIEYQEASAIGAFPLTKGSEWSYLDNGTDQSATGWNQASFDNSSWAIGAAPLGYGDPMTTTISYGSDSNNKHIAYYFTRDIEVNLANLSEEVTFGIRRDDGVIVYVNGVEVIRDNMPSGTITHTTGASNTVNSGDETNYFLFDLPKTVFQNGVNRISVQLHQKDGQSSDLGFDMFLKNKIAPAQYPLQKGTEWSYLDNGTNQSTTAWKELTFDNSTWATGFAPLGYGDPAVTTISYGPNSSDKYITYYFSRDLEIELANVADQVELGLRRDDGAIIYVNGVEIVRDNMPAGTIDNTTWSVNTIDGADEKRYTSYFLPKTIFQDGVNRISIEIHQRDGQSSDLGFDLYIQDKAPEYVCEEGHIACFTSINPTTQTPVLIIPEEQRFQLLFKQGSAYMDGSGTVPGNHDFTGYIPSTGETANTLGWLSVNHENNPGGVSIVDIELNDDALNPLWTVNNSRKVDFSTPDLVKTERNCSGGITPWGTVITAEESTSAGDTNGDGFEDVGWLVEIDPVTSSVMDYNNDGVKDKLFHLGRMNHENIVVSNDGALAYYGEDGGTHCLYKFVANTPGNITAGNVYVLKLDLELSNDEPSSSTAVWIQVPNITPADCNNMRSNAAALGGTNFNGVEDVEIGPDGMIYFTTKGKNRVFRFKDNGTTVSDFETFVGGMSYPIETAEGTVTESWSDGNDNLAFDDKGNLWVVQDGGRNYIWVVRPGHRQSAPQVLLHTSVPAGAEPTGLTFSPDFKYGFFSVQHPNGNTDSQEDATGENIAFNASAALVFSNQAFLGAQEPLSNGNDNLASFVRLYPNPTKDVVTLSLNENTGEKVMIEVYDILGRKVLENNTQTTGSNQNIELNLSQFTGEQVFLIRVNVGQKSGTYKVVKTN
ncbi:alkaline phosphatase PhoX [Flavobacterium soli]|uniref:alkaline phosphatase PhoX n=1 Tax=Flavobacterium soli TaxID=344881 RepID=UPI0004256B99|nr:alkaline phosphatase PhoX [Flavobacterium soli]